MTKRTSIERFNIARNAYSGKRYFKTGTEPIVNFIIPKSKRPTVGDSVPVVEVSLDKPDVVIENMGTELVIHAKALSDEILDQISVLLEDDVLA